MSKTIIRHASGTDFEVLLRIDAASFPADIAYDRTELSYFMNRKGAETLVLESGGEIAAFILFYIVEARKMATIVTLDVLEAFRRKGFASLLLKRAEEILHSHTAETVNLQVEVGNAAAIDCYRKHGFLPVRVLKEYYSNGRDAYLMVKTLRPRDGVSRSALPAEPGFLP
jgi:ribosomal-protein-alanine N-acetyltransferase